MCWHPPTPSQKLQNPKCEIQNPKSNFGFWARQLKIGSDSDVFQDFQVLWPLARGVWFPPGPSNFPEIGADLRKSRVFGMSLGFILSIRDSFFLGSSVRWRCFSGQQLTVFCLIMLGSLDQEFACGICIMFTRGKQGHRIQGHTYLH